MNNLSYNWKEVFELPFTKETINDIVAQIRESIESGESDAVQDYTLAWFLSQLTEAVMKDETIKKSVLQEQARYSKFEQMFKNGLKIERMSVTRYEYEGKGFEVIKEMTARAKEIEKQAQEIAKNVQTKGTIIHPETGEELEILPAKKLVTDTPKISFKK